MDGYTDELITDALEWAIRKELVNRAVWLCATYMLLDEFTAAEAQLEMDNMHRQVLDWDSTKELPGWAKDNVSW